MWLLRRHLHIYISVLMFAGDDPPRDRTGELRKLGFPTRHLGSIQMTTDTALGVTKKVVDDSGTPHLLFTNYSYSLLTHSNLFWFCTYILIVKLNDIPYTVRIRPKHGV